MKIHQLPAGEALESLKTTLDGLASSEAARRLREFGANQVERAEREPSALLFLRQVTHFLALVLWLAAALAFFSELRRPGQGMAKLGWAIVAVVLVNAVFSFWQERRARETIAALERL